MIKVSLLYRFSQSQWALTFIGMDISMEILIIGAGRVGLLTGVALAKQHIVTLLDTNPLLLESIRNAKCPFYERGLPSLLKESVEDKRMAATTYEEMGGPYDVVLICVPTPSRQNGSIDLSALEIATTRVFNHLNTVLGQYATIVVRSTVPPGTTRRLLSQRIPEWHRSRIAAAFNPEFFRQGSALQDIRHPDRIILGTEDKEAYNFLKRMYRNCIDSPDAAFLSMSLESAELAKYASNCFLGLKISYANQIADIAEQIPNANLEDVLRGMTMDHRITPYHLNAGAGFGGSCLPKDLKAIRHFSETELGIPGHLFKATSDVNDGRVYRILMLVKDYVELEKGDRVSILGIAFKPGTDDTRESPSLKLASELAKLGFEVIAHDPVVSRNEIPINLHKSIRIENDIIEAVRNASLSILMTEWDDYLTLGLYEITRPMRRKIFIDARRAFVGSQKPDDVLYLAIGSYAKGRRADEES
ncbi:MAG: UDP-glucose/GDP-mannose dehydrogenase family protein [Candidatus Thorarchaeota archaeon]|nr:UDP-glucose/GDP-mannose dehydrogenase family protein [Candidatus Thorarchaeota archaeon]